MVKRVFIIHGWEGSPGEGWYPWLKKELEKKGFEVYVPEMPNTEHPKIDEWTSKIKEIIPNPDENTFFVGHSIGGQAILRYLEKLQDDVKIGGVIFVSGWFDLTEFSYTKEPEYEEESRRITKPWIKSPINFDKIREHSGNFVAIFSDNDPYVLLSNKEIFEKNLGAKIIIEKNKGHFREEDNIKELPIVIEELLKM